MGLSFKEKQKTIKTDSNGLIGKICTNKEGVKVHGLVINFPYLSIIFFVENTNYGGSGIYSIFKGGYIIIQNAELDIESILAHFHNDMIKPVFIQKIIKTVKVCP